MACKVVILASAEQDLKELSAAMLKTSTADTWRTTYAHIKEAVCKLANAPQAARMPEEIDKLHLTQYRQWRSGMNRLIYEVRQEVIYIHIIADARRDMNTLLTRRLLRVI